MPNGGGSGSGDEGRVSPTIRYKARFEKDLSNPVLRHGEGFGTRAGLWEPASCIFSLPPPPEIGLWYSGTDSLYWRSCMTPAISYHNTEQTDSFRSLNSNHVATADQAGASNSPRCVSV